MLTTVKTAILLLPIVLLANEYTIEKNDNLWNLSGKYLGDPYKWQEIWKNNGYITNPDLIYPGNKLNLDISLSNNRDNGSQLYGRELTVNEPTFQEKIAGLNESNDSDTTIIDTTKKVDSSFTKIPEELKADYRANYLRTLPHIYSEGKTASGGIYPGVGRIEDNERALYSIGMRIKVVADEGKSFTQGKHYDLSHSIKFMTYKGKKINIVKPVGSGVIINSWGDNDTALLELTDVWDQIVDGDRVEEIREFKQLVNPTIIMDVPPLELNVIIRSDMDVAVKPQDNMLLSGGSKDGVHPGDLFQAFTVDSRGNLGKERAFIGMVVMVDDNTSTFVVTNVSESVRDNNYLLKRFGQLKFQ